NLVDTLQSEAEKLPAQIGNATEILSDIGARIVSSVFAVVTVLILSIFLVSGGAKWVDRFLAVQEPEHAERMRRTLDRVADAISKYVAGALIQATIAGVAGFIMLTILDAPFAG